MKNIQDSFEVYHKKRFLMILCFIGSQNLIFNLILISLKHNK